MAVVTFKINVILHRTALDLSFVARCSRQRQRSTTQAHTTRPPTGKPDVPLGGCRSSCNFLFFHDGVWQQPEKPFSTAFVVLLLVILIINCSRNRVGLAVPVEACPFSACICAWSSSSIATRGCFISTVAITDITDVTDNLKYKTPCPLRQCSSNHSNTIRIWRCTSSGYYSSCLIFTAARSTTHVSWSLRCREIFCTCTFFKCKRKRCDCSTSHSAATSRFHHSSSNRQKPPCH